MRWGWALVSGLVVLGAAPAVARSKAGVGEGEFRHAPRALRGDMPNQPTPSKAAPEPSIAVMRPSS